MFLFLPYEIEDLDIRKAPVVTYLLIAVNAAAFIAMLFLGEERRYVALMELGLVPEEWHRVHTFFTSMFLHAGWLHVISNMYFLWLFGRAVEDRLGKARFTAFYLAAGVAAALTHIATIPGFFSDLSCIGASGAISGVLGALMVLAPSVRVKCFYLWILFLRPLMGTVTLPAALFLGSWFLIQLLYGLVLSGAAMGVVGVAFWAHIGGFAFGALVAGGPELFRRAARGLRRMQAEKDLAGALQTGWQDDPAGAVRRLEQLGKSAAAGAGFDLALARLYWRAGKSEKAASLGHAALEKALAARDRAGAVDSYVLLSCLGRASEVPVRSCLAVAKGLDASGNPGEARGLLLEALRRTGDGPGADLIVYELAEISMKEGDRSRARDIYKLFLKLYPCSKLSASARYCLDQFRVSGTGH